MAEPTLALQKLIRARLIIDPAVTDLVPATAIMTSTVMPDTYPSVLIGTGYAATGDYWHDEYKDETFADLHIWTEEKGFDLVKAIAGAVRKALRGYPWEASDYLCHALDVERMEFMRDPDHLHAHGVVTVRAIMQECAA